MEDGEVLRVGPRVLTCRALMTKPHNEPSVAQCCALEVASAPTLQVV
jgi:hypothetical protein